VLEVATGEEVEGYLAMMREKQLGNDLSAYKEAADWDYPSPKNTLKPTRVRLL